MRGAEGQAKLWPGLTGLAAALVLFPLVMPSGVGGYCGLLIPTAAVAVACFIYRRVAEHVAIEWVAAALLMGGFVCLMGIEGWRLVTSGVEAQAISWGGVTMDALVAALTVMAVSQMSALRYVSRYFVVPMVTVVEGLVILHPELSLRFCVGMGLMLAAAVGLWRGADSQGHSPVKLL